MRPFSAILLSLSIALFAGTAGATIIGSDFFNYPDATQLTNSGYNDGVIDGQAGGTGWDYQNTDEGVPNAPSDWDSVFGSHPVVNGGALALAGQGVMRQYSGGDGNGGTSDEGSTQPSSEREGAARDTGPLYLRYTYLYEDVVGDINDWAGASSYDFGAEKVFFGIGSNPNRFTINQSGVGVTDVVSTSSNSFTPGSTIAATFGQTYTVIGALDFDADRLRLWVNPDGNDFDVAGSNDLLNTTADIIRTYTFGNWRTAVRLGAGAGVTATYQEILVGTDFAELNPASIPEPSSFALMLVALSGFVALRKAR